MEDDIKVATFGIISVSATGELNVDEPIAFGCRKEEGAGVIADSDGLREFAFNGALVSREFRAGPSLGTAWNRSDGISTLTFSEVDTETELSRRVPWLRSSSTCAGSVMVMELISPLVL